MNNSIKAAAKTMAAVIAAGAMAVAPVAGTINFGAMTAMAAEQTVASKITGLQGGEKIHAYQIIKANSDYTYSFVDGVETVLNPSGTADADKVTIANLSTKLTADKLNALATAVLNSSLTLTDVYATGGQSVTGDTATLNLGAGSYLILIDSANDESTIYSPMVLSNGYDDNSVLQAGTLQANGNYSGTSTAKHTSITPKKQIVNPDGTADGTNYSQTGTDSTDGDTTTKYAHADDLQVGDTGTFQIASQIPPYSDAYKAKDLTYYLVDNQEDDAFSAPTITAVEYYDIATNEWVAISKVETETAKGYISAAGSVTGNTFTPAENGKDFKVTFTSAWLKEHFNNKVRVRYTATLLATAKQGKNGNEDTVDVTYTNDLFDGTKTDTDKVTEYSFPINVLKTDAADNTKKLEGATFKITRVTLSGTTWTEVTGTGAYPSSNAEGATSNGNNNIAATNKDGVAKFGHLDEGYYKIQEQDPPKGYSTNGTEFYIHVVPTYASGALTGYTIYQVNKDTGADIQSGTTSVSGDDTTGFTLTVTDSPISKLPSTGARSALILTIAGIAVMIAVMAASRRKKIAD